MAIDGCNYDFPTLANCTFPHYMNCMYEALQNTYPVSRFSIKDFGPSKIIRKYDLGHEFHGCYVFTFRGSPKYVGISRKVITRIRQHVLDGSKQGTATLAAKMAARALGAETVTKTTKLAGWQHAFENAKKTIRRWRVAFIIIENDLEMHIFEAYCAMRLDTHVWNTFRTH